VTRDQTVQLFAVGAVIADGIAVATASWDVVLVAMVLLLAAIVTRWAWP
jgi:hypothetical protein